MRIVLTGGAYQAASLIAGAQQCVNLIPEAIPQGSGEPVPMAHYPTPGLRRLVTLSSSATNPFRVDISLLDGPDTLV